MRLFLHQLAGEQRLFWRSREAAIFTFLLPIMLFVLLGSVYGDSKLTVDGTRYKGSEYLLAGMLGFGVAQTAYTGLTISLVYRRESGVLKRLRATPLPPWAYVASVLASTLLVYTLEALVLVLLGRVLFGVHLPHQPGSLVLGLLLGGLSFAALGLATTALVRSAEGSSGVVNAIFFPMAFISGSFFSPHSFPAFLRAVAEVLPLTYFIRLVRDVMLRGDGIWTQPEAVAVVAAWGAVGAIAALRAFRWEPREG